MILGPFSGRHEVSGIEGPPKDRHLRWEMLWFCGFGRASIVLR